VIAEPTGHNLNVRWETKRTSSNKKREYLKNKINELKKTVRTDISGTYVEA
jgi:hypothetical protein